MNRILMNFSKASRVSLSRSFKARDHRPHRFEAVRLQVRQGLGTGGLQHLKGAVHKFFPLLNGQPLDPAPQLLIRQAGLPGDTVKPDKSVPQHRPGKAVMLHEALLVAVYHGVVLLVLQQHPYHGGFRHNGVDTLRQPDMPG